MAQTSLADVAVIAKSFPKVPRYIVHTDPSQCMVSGLSFATPATHTSIPEKASTPWRPMCSLGMDTALHEDPSQCKTPAPRSPTAHTSVGEAAETSVSSPVEPGGT